MPEHARGIEMTKDDLNQLNSLKEEIKELQKKIDALEKQKIGKVQDIVQASKRNFPYTQGGVVVEGIDIKKADRKNRLLIEKEILLLQRKAAAEQMEVKLTEYINSVSDSRVRRVMQYKYVEGYTWEQIGEILHCERTTLQKMVAKYLKENK